VIGLGKRVSDDELAVEQASELIWEVPVRDLLHRQRMAEVAVNEHGEIVLLPPPTTGGLLVDPELEFDWLISTLRAARSIARRERRCGR
jgi:hypothetical protein